MVSAHDLLCLYTANVRERDGSFVVEIPERELELGNVEADGTYRVALLPAAAGSESRPGKGSDGDRVPGAGSGPDTGGGRGQEGKRGPKPESEREAFPEPPVDEGETLEVEIEDIGDQGDGIARVGPGYVVIVPETDRGERVTVEITDVRENLAFAEVTERRDRFG